MLADDGVVHLDARVDQPVGVAAALAVALAQGRVEEGRVLRRVDLHVRAAEPDQLGHLAPREVDDVGQVGVARRVGAGRLRRVVVGGGLLGADQRDLDRLRRAGPQVDELLRAHAASPAQRVDHDRPLEDQLAALIVPERDRPPAELVEAVEGIDEVAEERVASQLAVGDDVEPGRLLQPDRLVDGPVLDALELGRGQPPGVEGLARVHQVGRAQEAADHVAPDGHRARSASRSTTSVAVVRSSPEARA